MQDLHFCCISQKRNYIFVLYKFDMLCFISMIFGIYFEILINLDLCCSEQICSGGCEFNENLIIFGANLVVYFFAYCF